MVRRRLWVVGLCALALTSAGCSKKKQAAPSAPRVGLVTDVGGRGDQSFNDSALRGLELWASGKEWKGGRYADLPLDRVQASLPPDLAARQPAIAPLGVQPVVVQSKAQEDYEPNLQLLVDQGVKLAIGTGFMLEPAVEKVARRSPNTQFLLIDSPLLDAKGTPVQLPNVRTVVFREEEGSFLAGALAGLVTKGKVGFVGGMEIPLIKRFEAGFRAGVQAAHPEAASTLRAVYTGSFDNISHGKQLTQDLLAKGVDVVFHAAGSDGLGVIQAVKEARAAGAEVFVIGVDSDQHALAPEAVLSSMVKRVDLAVYETVRDFTQGKPLAGDRVLGLKEGGVTLAEVRVELPNKAEVLARVDALRAKVVAGEVQIPATLEALETFRPNF